MTGERGDGGRGPGGERGRPRELVWTDEETGEELQLEVEAGEDFLRGLVELGFLRASSLGASGRPRARLRVTGRCRGVRAGLGSPSARRGA